MMDRLEYASARTQIISDALQFKPSDTTGLLSLNSIATLILLTFKIHHSHP